MSDQVLIRVPATTANLGPGFDVMGVALNVYNWVSLERGTRGVADAFVEEAADRFFQTARIKPFRFRWKVRGDVPRSRGMGSSVTVRLGLLAGLNQLCGQPLSRESLFETCTALEGHPDNAAPATFGGFVAGGSQGQRARFSVAPTLRFVLLIPEFEMPTEEARKVVPRQYSRADAIHNIAHASLITAAFASRRYSLLRGAFSDRLHQPYREKLIPFLTPCIIAGVQAGALGGWLSGSGSTIACVTLKNPERVAAAMHKAIGEIPARTVIARADNGGVRIEPA